MKSFFIIKRALIIVLITMVFGLVGCAGNMPANSEQTAKPVMVSSLINLSVKGADYHTLTQFKEKLQKIRGVKKAYQMSFSLDKASLLRVEYAGITQNLADSLQSISMGTIQIKILQFDPTEISIQLSSKAKSAQ